MARRSSSSVQVGRRLPRTLQRKSRISNEAPETDESEDESGEQSDDGSAEAVAATADDEQPKMPVEKAYYSVNKFPACCTWCGA